MIQMPIGWAWDRVRLTVLSVGSARPEEYWAEAEPHREVPAIHRIGAADLQYALAKGFEDFGAHRTDVVFLCVLYPVIGLILARLAFGYGLLQLLFPLAAGFALVGPFAAVGLNEMSRRREQGIEASWADAFGVLRSPSIGAIALLGLLLIEIFLLWLLAAQAIYDLTLGPAPPASIASFIHDLFATRAGWALIIVGVWVGFLFAVAVLAISVVSFPMLLDQNVGLGTAVRTSILAVVLNQGPMARWGLIVRRRAGDRLGALPHRACGRASRAGTCHVAPLPPRGAALIGRSDRQAGSGSRDKGRLPSGRRA